MDFFAGPLHLVFVSGQVMLTDEGQYSETCEATGEKKGSSGLCPEQAAKFAAIFATATFLVNGISLPSGLFLDRCGGRAMSGEAMLHPLVGSVCGVARMTRHMLRRTRPCALQQRQRCSPSWASPSLA